jgi:raffinose/stachyose/melibiose transport system substrate-binding protein
LAASTAASPGGASGTIRFLAHTAIESSLAPIIKDFEQAYPKIHVNAQYVAPGNTYVQALTTQVQGGNTPDVFYTNAGPSSNGTVSLVPLAKAGKLANLAGEPWSGQVPQAAHDLYWVNGGLYGLPLFESPLAVEYNATEFHKLGLTPPTTWAQMLQLCTKIKAAGKIPIGEPGQAAVILPLEIAASSVYANDAHWDAQRAAGQVTFAGSAGWQEALQRVQQMNKLGCFQPGAAGTSVPAAFQMVGSGQALMFVGPVDAIGAFGPNAASTFAAFPIPGNTPASTYAMITYSDALAVSSTSSNKAAAIKFVNFVASAAEASKLAKLNVAISLSQAQSLSLPAALSSFTPFYKANKVVSYAPDAWPNGGVLLSGLLPGTTGLLTGQQTPATVLKTMDQQWSK